jgi:hypothetical protein
MAEKKEAKEKSKAKAPSRDELEAEIRAAAQRIFDERRAKGLAGDEVADWLAAEAEVTKKHKLP